MTDLETTLLVANIILLIVLGINISENIKKDAKIRRMQGFILDIRYPILYRRERMGGFYGPLSLGRTWRLLFDRITEYEKNEQTAKEIGL